ncbi:hypothetical protein L195_g036908 [Trifolium pratense]|uniref:Uncharacterized protein n=1 Tax=Trifolium pratense TaxID=57577 RepID=A0A2K3LQT2_TRIPR|nr:hypothetical protein L195_g036908 [Trifolium pratense]
MASHTDEGEAGQIEKTQSLAEGQEQRASSHPRMQKENGTYALEKKKYKIALAAVLIEHGSLAECRGVDADAAPRSPANMA